MKTVPTPSLLLLTYTNYPTFSNLSLSYLPVLMLRNFRIRTLGTSLTVGCGGHDMWLARAPLIK